MADIMKASDEAVSRAMLAIITGDRPRKLNPVMSPDERTRIALIRLAHTLCGMICEMTGDSYRDILIRARTHYYRHFDINNVYGPGGFNETDEWKQAVTARQRKKTKNPEPKNQAEAILRHQTWKGDATISQETKCSVSTVRRLREKLTAEREIHEYRTLKGEIPYWREGTHTQTCWCQDTPDPEPPILAELQHLDGKARTILRAVLESGVPDGVSVQEVIAAVKATAGDQHEDQTPG